MKKILLVAAFMALCGLFVSVKPAMAQFPFTYNLTTNDNNGSLGSYNVVVIQDDPTTFHIQSVVSNLANQPRNDVFPFQNENTNQVQISFFTGMNASGGVIPILAATNGGIAPNPAGTPVTLWNNFSDNDQGLWKTLSNSGNLLLADGSNMFKTVDGGVIKLTAAPQSFRLQVTGPGSNSWGIRANVPAANVVPEPSSLALLLPGLGAVGLMMRRRRSMKQA